MHRLAAYSASLTLLASFALACAGPESIYEARVRRTAYGIAHIEAENLASLGFGEGYAQAEDHLCSIADQVVRARGERARYFGRGPNSDHLNSDITMRALGIYSRAGDDLAQQPQEIRDWYDGYVAGYNDYLAKTGAAKVPGWCRGAEWVFPISTTDLAAYHRAFTMTSTLFERMIATAAPPSSRTASSETRTGFPLPDVDRASNGWALGSERTASGSGMLVANPHYPWVGSNRFWEKHLVIPGEMDVYGVGLIGVPGVAIGFNRAVGWTHTVSAGQRMTLYSLDLAPGDPTSYLYDGNPKAMKQREVSVDVLGEDGTLERHEQTIYFSHYGPILNFQGFEWNERSALTLRDANADNDEIRGQWLAMGKAASLEEFQAAHAEFQGMPWVNTIAASADGRAWYADTSSTPNLSAEAIELWMERRESDPRTAAAWRLGLVLLDGSDPTFEWVDDERARDPGVVPYEDMPQLERADYVFNANDSYWLANSGNLLTGYSPLHGGEGTARSPRTRMNDLTLADLTEQGASGADARFTMAELKEAILSNRSLMALELKDRLVARCQGRDSVFIDGEAIDITAGCAVLEAWSGEYELDSVGAVLFREWVTQYSTEDLGDAGALFSVAFDPADPVRTPSGLAPGSLAIERLGRAVKLLDVAGVDVDAALGDVQYAARGDRRIAMHGGDGTFEGIENFVRNRGNGTTLEPLERPAGVEGSRFLTEDGYPINSGTSFLMALEYSSEGPKAEAFLTYGQSGDPKNEHFWDQTELFSRKEWRPVLFEEAEIDAGVVSDRLIESTEKVAPEETT
ncbi:MAG: acylase [Acidobacteriota bacterium]